MAETPDEAPTRHAEMATHARGQDTDNDQSGSEAEASGSTKPTKQRSGSDSDTSSSKERSASASAPPLPDEPVPGPPLPDEPVPAADGPPDDGWEAVFDPNSQSYYFYNSRTGVTQWENPRVPEANDTAEAGSAAPPAAVATDRPHGGYNPAIHGDYDPNAPYAQEARAAEQRAAAAQAQGTAAGAPAEPDYAAAGHFNRFTGRWQADVTPEDFNDDAKSRRQMGAFFDVDAAANSHDGRSLRAERSAMKISKSELKAFKQKRRERKEEKRRAWLRD